MGFQTASFKLSNTRLSNLGKPYRKKQEANSYLTGVSASDQINPSWSSMSTRTSIFTVISIGLLVVNGPVLLLLGCPLLIFGQFVKSGEISSAYNWLGLPVSILLGFILAWLWWSLSVPKWRLWAYQRVDDIAMLKVKAIAVGLTWPDNHFFSRTEIKSHSHVLRERELEERSAEDRKSKGFLF